MDIIKLIYIVQQEKIEKIKELQNDVERIVKISVN